MSDQPDVVEQHQIRHEKRARMIGTSREPYPVDMSRTHTLAQVRAGWPDLAAGAETDDIVEIGGRVVFLRNTGKLCFATLQDGFDLDSDGQRLQVMVSLAEVMVPGIALPSYEDAPIKTADAMCSCQRRALESAYATKPGKTAIDASLRGAKPTFDSMSRDAVAMLFGATAAILGQGNNAGGLRLLVGDADPNRPDFSHRTPAGLQKIHDNFWAAKTPATARR